MAPCGRHRPHRRGLRPPRPAGPRPGPRPRTMDLTEHRTVIALAPSHDHPEQPAVTADGPVGHLLAQPAMKAPTPRSRTREPASLEAHESMGAPAHAGQAEHVAPHSRHTAAQHRNAVRRAHDRLSSGNHSPHRPRGETTIRGPALTHRACHRPQVSPTGPESWYRRTRCDLLRPGSSRSVQLQGSTCHSPSRRP